MSPPSSPSCKKAMQNINTTNIDNGPLKKKAKVESSGNKPSITKFFSPKKSNNIGCNGRNNVTVDVRLNTAVKSMTSTTSPSNTDQEKKDEDDSKTGEAIVPKNLTIPSNATWESLHDKSVMVRRPKKVPGDQAPRTSVAAFDLGKLHDYYMFQKH